VVNDVVIESLNSVDFCYLLDPTQPCVSCIATNTSPIEDKDVTVLALNCTTSQHPGAMLIKLTHAVANTGATSAFIMDSIPTKNKRLAVHSIQINLPDGRRVTSSHIQDITIPGLPITLTGHIILDMTMASLLGIWVYVRQDASGYLMTKRVAYIIKVNLY
jgi:hypothetical protein